MQNINVSVVCSSYIYLFKHIYEDSHVATHVLFSNMCAHYCMKCITRVYEL